MFAIDVAIYLYRFQKLEKNEKKFYDILNTEQQNRILKDYNLSFGKKPENFKEIEYSNLPFKIENLINERAFSDKIKNNLFSRIEELKNKIQTAQIKANVLVNRELILLYWNIGKEILNNQQKNG